MVSFNEFFSNLMNKLKIPSKKEEKVILGKESLFEKQEIEKYSDFLKDFGDNYEQKRAVVSNEQRILVLAGAGSGKTKVLTKRIIHLIKNKNVPLNEITAVTFTKEAAKEMRERVSADLKIAENDLRGQIRTIHSLCYGILRSNEEFSLITDKDQKEYVTKLIGTFRNDKNLMNSLYNYLRYNLIEKVASRETDTDYDPLYKIKPQDLGKRLIPTSVGIMVRSKAERDVANLLTSMGVKWRYEVQADWADQPFKPDFIINEDTYVEVWCYNDNTPEFSRINKKKYLADRKWKEEQFKKHKKTLIPIEFIETYDLLLLQKKLKTELSKIDLNVTENEILDLLNLDVTSYKKSLNYFIDELMEIMNLIKAEMIPIEEVERRVADSDKDGVKNFYAVLFPIMNKYEEVVKSKDFGKKDFNDLIIESVELLTNNEDRRKYYQNKIKYLLVDEFQDVSKGEIELIKLLSNDNASLFAVGDDWQGIYGWRGARVDYILNFDREFGECEKIILPINYRSSKNIVDASNSFIQTSDKSIKKNIQCCIEKKIDDSKIIQVDAPSFSDGARYIIQKVRKLKDANPSLKIDDFLVLYRNRNIFSKYLQEFKRQDFKIPCKTIHWSKGKEARHVFVLGLTSGMFGFPTVYPDKDIRKIIVENPIEEKEEEERRIMYVAMTRARDGLYLISQKNANSSFIKDIPKNTIHVVGNQ